MNTNSKPAAGKAANVAIAARPSVRETVCLTVAIGGWFLAVGMAWWTVSAYEFRHERAEREAVLGRWPTGSSLTLASDRPTLLFFMHPKCPCTRAALVELKRLWLVAQQRPSKDTPRLIVVATVPTDAGDDWFTTDTMERARALAGAEVVIDRDGQEAMKFGVATSSKVKWFDRAGHCLYSGGITASRGHEGANAGADSLARLLEGATETVTGLPAFGCRLCLPNEKQRAAGESAEAVGLPDNSKN